MIVVRAAGSYSLRHPREQKWWVSPLGASGTVAAGLGSLAL